MSWSEFLLQKILHNLVKDADIFGQNFRPGVAEKLNFDYDTLSKINPKIVYGSISGYGNKGPWKDLPGQDLLAQSRSGLVWLNGNGGEAPTPMGLAAADMLAGHYMVEGILSSFGEAVMFTPFSDNFSTRFG